VNDFLAIRRFLAAIRRRQRRVALGAWSLLTLAALAVLGLATVLAAAALAESRAGAVGLCALALGAALVVGWLVVALVQPRRSSATDAQVARFIGKREPRIASDLLSAVELEGDLGGGSQELARAFAASTAGRVTELRPEVLVPDRPLKRAWIGLLGIVVCGCALVLLMPARLLGGWHRLARASEPPAAKEIEGPLVADLGLELVYPQYTARPTLRVPASSGDILAPRGTDVTIDARILRPAVKAEILLELPEAPQPLTIALELHGDHVHGHFTVDKAATWRIRLAQAAGERLVEAEHRRIDIEEDHPPRVDLVAPADELEVSAQKRIELGYSSEDDYGLTEISLVWHADGGKAERKVLARPSGKTAEGRHLWDLTLVPLPPGARIEYFLEARDNDSLHGPNVGTSRHYVLKVYSPRERHEQVVAQLRTVFELMIGALARRLTLEPGDRGDPPASPVGGGGQRRAPVDEESRNLAARDDGDLAGAIAGVTAQLGDDPLAPKGLADELVGMQRRLDKLGRDETSLMSRLGQRLAAVTAGKAWSPALLELDKKASLELERDTLVLEDWLSRLAVEEMLAIGDELAKRREHLADLMKQYAEHPSAALKEEIAREEKAVEELEREMLDKQAELPGEVADRFMNMEALSADEDQACMTKVREALAAGDMKAAQARLAECQAQAADAQKAREDALRQLRDDKFSPEEQALGELMNDIADLEQAERQLSKESADIEERAREAAAEASRDQVSPGKDKARKTLDRLDERLKKVPKDGLTPFSQDELDAMKKRLETARKMLDEGDLGEALEQSRQAKDNLHNVLGDLDDDMSDGQPWSDKTDEAMEQASKAEPEMDQLVSDLEHAVPSPEDVMSPEDRARLKDLARRQAALRDKAKKLAQKTKGPSKSDGKEPGGKLPGQSGEAARKGLESAGQKMAGAGKRMQGLDPRGAREESGRAADELGQLRQSVQRASRPTQVADGNGSDDHDDVKIPGADEYKTPADFREKVLEGKQQGHAPPPYKDDVEEYYKEISR
jgi:hypothetical protein